MLELQLLFAQMSGYKIIKKEKGTKRKKKL